MTDDIRALTARVADEPGSLAFLELAESLRRRGQLDAAYKVARGGLTRYPGLADAHDLMARILSDRSDLAGAFEAWSSALQLDPMRTSALKGIAFLYFRAGDTAAALEHLQRAHEVDPDDRSIDQALARLAAEQRVAGSREPGDVPDTKPSSLASPPEVPLGAPLKLASDAGRPGAGASTASQKASSPFDGLEGGGEGLLLIDSSGLRLGGSLNVKDGGESGDRVAAQLAGLSKEAARATRLLGLGTWESIAVESPDGHFVLAPPTPDTLLMAAREPSLPVGRVVRIAERAARAARTWLEAP